MSCVSDVGIGLAFSEGLVMVCRLFGNYGWLR